MRKFSNALFIITGKNGIQGGISWHIQLQDVTFPRTKRHTLHTKRHLQHRKTSRSTTQSATTLHTKGHLWQTKGHPSLTLQAIQILLFYIKLLTNRYLSWIAKIEKIYRQNSSHAFFRNSTRSKTAWVFYYLTAFYSQRCDRRQRESTAKRGCRNTSDSPASHCSKNRAAPLTLQP